MFQGFKVSRFQGFNVSGFQGLASPSSPAARFRVSGFGFGEPVALLLGSGFTFGFAYGELSRHNAGIGSNIFQ